MRPHTQTLPKALIPVAGQAFLHHQLTHLASTGVTNAVLSVGHLGEHIRSFVGNGSAWGIRVLYSDEGENLRGTGGAIRLAFDHGLLEENFLLTYGDSYLPINFSQVFSSFLRSRSKIAMCVYKNCDAGDRSNVLFREGKVVLYDKKNPSPEMHHIDYGLFGLHRSLVQTRLNAAPPSDFSCLLNEISKEGGIFGIEVHERFHEIGSPEGLQNLEAHLVSVGKTKDDLSPVPY